MIAPSTLHQLLKRARAAKNPKDEIALIDVREPGEFKQGHLFLASNVPLSRLEWLAPRLLPRREVRVVVCAADSSDPRVDRAIKRLERAGYTNVQRLNGTFADCEKAGFVIFTGFNVPSKTFGEWLEQSRLTPHIAPDHLAAQLRGSNPPLIFDCRPLDEHIEGALPGAIHAPGVELPKIVASHLRNEEQPVVVHCAGRTRGILAAQFLIDLGLPNPAATLLNGLMGWEMAGQQKQRPAPSLRAEANETEAATQLTPYARALAEGNGVAKCTVDDATLPADRTVYGFTVGTAEEAERYTPYGFHHVPGGQLLQALDDYVAVQGARILIHAHDEHRAALVAAYLAEMGWRDVRWCHATQEADLVASPTVSPVAAIPVPNIPTTNSVDAKDFILNESTWVLDLGDSRRYREKHLPGAGFIIRAELPERFASLIPPSTAERILLTCTDGTLSAAAQSELAVISDLPVYVLQGGVEAWGFAARPLQQEALWHSPPLDVPTTPYDVSPAEREQHMRDYIAWELELLDGMARDGVVEFGAASS